MAKYIDFDIIKEKLRSPKLGLDSLCLEETIEYFGKTALGKGCRNKEVRDWELSSRYENMEKYSQQILKKSKLEEILEAKKIERAYDDYLQRAGFHKKNSYFNEKTVFNTIRNFSHLLRDLKIEKSEETLELEKNLISASYENREPLKDKFCFKIEKYAEKIKHLAKSIGSFFNEQNTALAFGAGSLAFLLFLSSTNSFENIKKAIAENFDFSIKNRKKVMHTENSFWNIEKNLENRTLVLDGSKYESISHFLKQNEMSEDSSRILEKIIGDVYQRDDIFSISLIDKDISLVSLENQRYKGNNGTEPLVVYVNPFYFPENSFAVFGDIVGWESNILKSFCRLFQIEKRYGLDLTNSFKESTGSLKNIDLIVSTAIQEITSDPRNGHIISDSWMDARGLLQVKEQAVEHLYRDGFISFSWQDVLNQYKQFEKTKKVSDFEKYHKMLLEVGIKFKINIALRDAKRHKRFLPNISEEVLSDLRYLGSNHIVEKIRRGKYKIKSVQDVFPLYEDSYPVSAVEKYVNTGIETREALNELKRGLRLEHAYPRMQEDYFNLLDIVKRKDKPYFVFEFDTEKRTAILKERTQFGDRIVRELANYN